MSEQIREIRQKMLNKDETLVNLTERKEMNYEQRLEMIEKFHEHILKMIDQLKQRVDQIEFNNKSVRV